MCAVSNVGDSFNQRWPQWPQIQGPQQGGGLGGMSQGANQFSLTPGITREEFNALKNEIEEMKKLLIAAKEEDKKNGAPDCEMEEKVKVLRAIADLVGVNLDEVFGKKE